MLQNHACTSYTSSVCVCVCVQLVSRLGGTLPVLIETEGWEQIAEEVDDLTIGDAEVRVCVCVCVCVCVFSLSVQHAVCHPRTTA